MTKKPSKYLGRIGITTHYLGWDLPSFTKLVCVRRISQGFFKFTKPDGSQVNLTTKVFRWEELTTKRSKDDEYPEGTNTG